MKILEERNEFLKKCGNCSASLEFDVTDVKTAEFGLAYIICPRCKNKIFLENGNFDKKITYDNILYPNDFYHHRETEVTKLSDEAIQDYVSKVARNLKAGSGFSMMACGDTLVIGKKYDDGEISIYVAKNYSELDYTDEDFYR